MTDLPSPIPDQAQEVIIETWETGAKSVANYVLDGQRVGRRAWSETGQLDMEYGVQDERMHGWYRTWHENGQLCEMTWYEQGQEHGTNKQYDEQGNLIGTYTMVHGTGVDLWFAKPGVITEERHYQGGAHHGYERWWTGDNQTISEESHFWHGVEHGIFREWNEAGRLRRGYPSYFVSGNRVNKRQYMRACQQDPTLPPFSADDNVPTRQLPDGVKQGIQLKEPENSS